MNHKNTPARALKDLENNAHAHSADDVKFVHSSTGKLEKATSERRLFRPISQIGAGSSASVGQEMVPLSSKGNQSGSMQQSRTSLRSRTPSGKSVRSRRVSPAAYHQDLKQDLKQGLTRNLIFMSFIIVIGNTFLFGYNIGVLNQPTGLIKQFYNETYSRRRKLANASYDEDEGMDEYEMTFLWSLTTSLYVPGGMIGAFAAGFIADKLGRKGAVILNCIPSIIGGALATACVAASAPELLMIGRFIVGLSCGMGTALGPMYLMEICPFNYRGAFGTLSQLACTLGIFLASIFGLREILGTEDLWPYLQLINTGAALLCLVCMPFLPDSPRYLMLIKHDREAAEKALKFVRQSSDVYVDMEEMETEFQAQQNAASASGDESYTMMRLLRTRELHMPLLITVMLQITQQLSGINAIFFYSTSIFENAGVAQFAIQYAVVGTCAVNVAMTIIAVPIMDKAGRRPLLLFPMGVMILILGIIVMALKLQTILAWMSYISIACVIVYVICFAIGLGPIPSMLSAELFRQGPRPRAMSVGGLTNWLFTLVVGISFELVQKLIKEYTFLIFLVLMIGFEIFIFFFVPETKNKTFEEIASKFQKGPAIEVEEVITDDEDNVDEEPSGITGQKPQFELEFEDENLESSGLLHENNKTDGGIGTEKISQTQSAASEKQRTD